MTPHNPTPPTMKSILSSIESIDTKKESLRKALEDLQSHSSSLSSFTLQWKDLEDHFDSIKQSIQERFQLLQSRDPIPIPKLELPPVKLEPSSSSSTTHPELKKYCVNNDGIGLRTYILNNRKELVSIRDELKFALELASDPGKLVIDAMKGFYPQNNNNNNNNNNNSSKGDKDGELAALRRTCLLLLEQLMSVVKDKGEEFSVQVKESAKKLGIEWKGKVSGGSDSPLEPLAFLQLLASYGLGSEFDSSEVLDLAVSIARRKQAIDLLRALRMPDKIPVVQHACVLSCYRVVFAARDCMVWYCGDRCWRQMIGRYGVPCAPMANVIDAKSWGRIQVHEVHASGGPWPDASSFVVEQTADQYYRWWNRVSMGPLLPPVGRTSNFEFVGLEGMRRELRIPHLPQPVYNPQPLNAYHLAPVSVSNLQMFAVCGPDGEATYIFIPGVPRAHCHELEPQIDQYTTAEIRERYENQICMFDGMRIVVYHYSQEREEAYSQTYQQSQRAYDDTRNAYEDIQQVYTQQHQGYEELQAEVVNFRADRENLDSQVRNLEEQFRNIQIEMRGIEW